MNAAKVTGYAKKPKKELIKAIDDCVSLSQLFALIQHENITMQMHSQPGASNLAPKVLSAQEIIDKKDTPLERLKTEIKKSVLKKQIAVVSNFVGTTAVFCFKYFVKKNC